MTAPVTPLTLSERIDAYVKASGDTLTAIAERANLKGTYIFRNRENKPINLTWKNLSAICLACPRLSAEWLMRQEYPILLDQPAEPGKEHYFEDFLDRVHYYMSCTNTSAKDMVEISGLHKHNLISRKIKAETEDDTIYQPANMTWANMVKLLAAFPNFSAEFLLRGAGSPIRELPDDTETKEEDSPSTEEPFSSLLQEYMAERRDSNSALSTADLLISSMQETIRAQRELINALQAQLSLKN